MIAVSSTVRFISEDLKGQMGQVVQILADDENETLLAVRLLSDGQNYACMATDVEVVDVFGLFDVIVAEVEPGPFVADLYDAPPPIDGIPIEPAFAKEEEPEVVVPEDDDDEDEDDDEDDHPDEPHVHLPDGSTRILPHLLATDPDGDQFLAIDITGNPRAREKGVVAAFRVYAPSVDRTLEVHMSAAQMVALARWAMQQYGPQQGQQ